MMTQSRRLQVGELLCVTGTHEAMDHAISQLSANELAEVITTMKSFDDLLGLDYMHILILAHLKKAALKQEIDATDSLAVETIKNICKGVMQVKPKMPLEQAEALYKAHFPLSAQELPNKNPDAVRHWMGFRDALIIAEQMKE